MSKSKAAVLVLAGTLFLGGCALPRYVGQHGDEAPDPALGRPGYVRVAARVGSWIGGLVGGVASVALLPITYPISLMAKEPLGYSREEFLYGPVSVGAGAGHFALGAPLDVVHFLVWRAWTDDGEDKQPGYDFVPMKEPGAKE